MDYITTAVRGPGTPVSVDESLDSTSTDSMSQSVEIDTILDGFDSDTTVSLPQLLHTSEMNQTHTPIVGQIPYLTNQSLCADTTVSSTVTPTCTQGLSHHISPLVRPTVSSDATRSLGCDAPQSTSAVFTGSNLRPSSSHGLHHTVSAVQTRSKTATSRPPPVPIQHEEPSSSQSHMRETTNSRHTFFDENSDDDQQAERPTSTQRLNIGNRSPHGEGEWHTVTPRRRRKSVQDVKIPSVQLHCATGPHSKNIHILRSAAEMLGRAGNVLDTRGKPLSHKAIPHAQFGTSDCTVCKLLRSKRQPVRRTGQLNRNPTGLQTTPSAGAAHYLSSKCTHTHQTMSFFDDNMWSPLLHQESHREPRILSMVNQLVESDCPSLTMAAKARLFESTSPNTVNLARPSRLQAMYCQTHSTVADSDTTLSARN